MRAVDLSLPLRSGMQVYPGDPEVVIDGALSVSHDGVAVARLGLNSHAGTHIDAPSHTIEGARTVDQIPLEWLAGEARVLRVRHPQPHTAITSADIVGGLPEVLPDIVFVATGWDRHAGTPEAHVHPFLAAELAVEIIARGARVVGIDALSPDPTGDADSDFPVHAIILGSDGVIAENLAGLEQVPDEFTVSLLPLRVIGGDGSPVRAVAWLDKWAGSGTESEPRHAGA